MVSLGIIIDRKCNIRCSHCCFSSCPQAEEHLSDEEIMRIITEGCNNSEVDTISLSGGEALLRKDIVLKAITYISQNGKKPTLVSNGFWGRNKKICFNNAY